MKKYILSSIVFITIIQACSSDYSTITVKSPDKEIEVNFFIGQNGQAGYLIEFKNRRVIDLSYFSFDFKIERKYSGLVKQL